MKSRSISNVFEALFSPQKQASKRNKTVDNHKDRYYKHIYMTKKNTEVIDIIAKTTGLSRKHIHDNLVDYGLRYVLSSLLTDFNEMRDQIKTGDGRQILYGECQKYLHVMREWSKRNGPDVTPFL